MSLIPETEAGTSEAIVRHTAPQSQGRADGAGMNSSTRAITPSGIGRLIAATSELVLSPFELIGLVASAAPFAVRAIGLIGVGLAVALGVWVTTFEGTLSLVLFVGALFGWIKAASLGLAMWQSKVAQLLVGLAVSLFVSRVALEVARRQQQSL